MFVSENKIIDNAGAKVENKNKKGRVDKLSGWNHSKNESEQYKLINNNKNRYAIGR